MSTVTDRVLILNFGSQYSQKIVTAVRKLNVYCELYPCDCSENSIIEFSPKAIILSGGPDSVTEEGSLRAPDIVFKLNIPVLGICYGMQTMSVQFGGKVESSTVKESGYAKISVNNSSDLLDDMGSTFDVWMSHGDKVTELPEGFINGASSENTPIAIMANHEKKFYGVQFHPEVAHTPLGSKLLSNFVHKIGQCGNSWNGQNILEQTVNKVRSIVGEGRVLLGLSGGVDSSVVAALLHKAIGKQLVCVFVDTGLLRLNEGDAVMEMFKGQNDEKENTFSDIKIIRVNAKDWYFDALKGIEEPEKKRKIIGKLFIDIFTEEARKLQEDGGTIEFLSQGTIYPDVIESGSSSKSHVIKSHHNVGGLPAKLGFKLLEPIRDLFKDEVRQLGLDLGLPEKMVYRHPFPGPGLAIRIVGEVTEEKANTLRLADNVFTQVLHKHNYYRKVNQAFVVLTPIKTVGVTGDQRTYGYTVALRAVETTDFMTAEPAKLPYDLLFEASTRITNEVPGISRVMYDISGKPPATIEWE